MVLAGFKGAWINSWKSWESMSIKLDMGLKTIRDHRLPRQLVGHNDNRLLYQNGQESKSTERSYFLSLEQGRRESCFYMKQYFSLYLFSKPPLFFGMLNCQGNKTQKD